MNTSTIRKLTVRAVRVPMTEPHRTASGVITESPLVLVDVLTDQGITGHAILFTYTLAALGPTARLVSNLAELVVGEALSPAAIYDRLSRRFRLLGTQGLVGMALAGIDMALWDALARLHNMSLWQLLGGNATPVPAYGAIGYDGVVESARVAEDWAKRGFRGVKAKIGYNSAQEDGEVVRAIRSAVGSTVAIMVDYNQSLTPIEAVQRIRVIEESDLTWVEEPTLAHDFEGHASIAREVETPIQCGENWWGPLDLRHAIRAKASDYVMPEVMKIGGITGWRIASALAEAHAIPMSNHLWPEISAQLLSVTPVAHWLEYSDWWNPILAQPLVIEQGCAQPGTAPGSGIEWNEQRVAGCLA